MNTIVECFNSALDRIEHDAKRAGSNLTEICREQGISRTTPDRGRQSPPATIRLVATLQDAVAAKLADAGLEAEAQEPVEA
jgi:hypothetical protein